MIGAVNEFVVDEIAYPLFQIVLDYIGAQLPNFESQRFFTMSLKVREKTNSDPTSFSKSCPNFADISVAHNVGGDTTSNITISHINVKSVIKPNSFSPGGPFTITLTSDGPGSQPVKILNNVEQNKNDVIFVNRTFGCHSFVMISVKDHSSNRQHSKSLDCSPYDARGMNVTKQVK